MRWGIWAILIFQVVAFLVVFVTMCIHGYRMSKSSDKRLEKANEMVLTLAHSADKLSVSVCEMKDMMVAMQKSYEDHLKVVQDNRDDFRDSYIKLLHKYELLESRIIDNYEKESSSVYDAIRELAKKPTIHNSNLADRV